MSNTVETRDEGHEERLRQAYGFMPPPKAKTVHYPVGVEDFDYSGWTTFHHSAASNDLTVLQDIISQDGFSHMESRTQYDGHGYTPLLCCCYGNAVNTFDVLIAHGADYKARDECDCGVVEITILSRSLALFEHILEAGYELKHCGLTVWKFLLSMLHRRDIDDGREMRYAAMEMTEKLVLKGRKFVDGFLSNGGMNAIADIIKECVNLSNKKNVVTPDLDSHLRQAIREEEITKRTSLYLRTLKTLYSILLNMTPQQGVTLRSNYITIIADLLILSNSSREEEKLFSSRCLEIVSSSPVWGVNSLLDTNGIQSLLRGVLLQKDNTGNFNIFRSAYSTDRKVVLSAITRAEVDVIMSILSTEQSSVVKLFFISLLSDIISQGKEPFLVYTDIVTSSLLQNIGSVDSITNSEVLKLLLEISEAPEGLVTIFKSENSFLYIAKRVVMETEERFDMCCKLLWKMIHSCGSSQDAVRVVENIGISTVVEMLESNDCEVKCVGAECVKILLNSHKTDHHNQLILKDVHTKLIAMIHNSSRGHVMYAAMTALSDLAISWHSISPLPVIQNAILQSGCIDRVVQVADSCRWHAAKLQSAAFRLISSTLIGNQLTEKRLANYYLDIMNDISKITKIDNDTAKHTLLALCVISLHNLTMNSDVRDVGDFARLPSNCDEIILLSKILKEVSVNVSNTAYYDQLLSIAEGDKEDTSERAMLNLASVCGFVESVDAIVKVKGVKRIITILLKCTGRKQASAATALAALSNIESGRTQLLIECKEDSSLLDMITDCSPTLPLSIHFDTMMKNSNSIRDHRRRVLSKEDKKSSATSRFPNIGVNLVFDRAISSGNMAVDKVRKKTPVPGDRHFQSMTDVSFSEITTLGLSRPYCKVQTLPEIFSTRKSWEQPPKTTSHDPRLIATVDRVYKKLYISPADSVSEKKQPITAQRHAKTNDDETNSSGTLPKLSQLGLARSLSIVF